MSRSRFFQKGVQLLSIVAKESKCFDSVVKELELQTFTKGHCVCSMVIGEEHTNGTETIHGGFIATLVGMATTFAIMGMAGKPGVSTDMSISYLKTARKGEEIKVDAKCLKIGKNLAFTTADVTLADGTLLAHGKHTKFFSKDSSILFPIDDEVD